jgi:hypothetical protein
MGREGHGRGRDTPVVAVMRCTISVWPRTSLHHLMHLFAVARHLDMPPCQAPWPPALLGSAAYLPGRMVLFFLRLASVFGKGCSSQTHRHHKHSSSPFLRNVVEHVFGMLLCSCLLRWRGASSTSSSLSAPPRCMPRWACAWTGCGSHLWLALGSAFRAPFNVCNHLRFA